MKAFIRNAVSRRWGYDGWAVKVKGANTPLEWTASTTRKEAREVKNDLEKALGKIDHPLEVVKVRIKVEAI